MKRYTTILFDFDGTVMDTNNVILQSWQHTFRTVYGEERPEEDIIRTFGEPLEITMKKMVPDRPLEEAIEIYRSYHKDNFGKLISVFPGMKELIAELSRQGYKLGLVTSRLKGTTYQGLEAYDLRQYFDCVITADDCTKHKPDPQPVLKALEKLGVKPDEAMMLGDSLFDIRCAHNAGVTSVLVGWAIAADEKDLVGDGKPDHRIDKAEDLLELL